jgi:hypothetical protein
LFSTQKIAGSAERPEVDRFVPLAKRRPAFTDERHRHASRPVAAERHRHAGDRQGRGRQRRGRRQDAPVEIADVQVLAVERRADFAHLGVEDHAHRIGLGPHRQRDAEIADDRTDDVAAPAAVGAAERAAASEPDAGGVDRLLTERAKSLALECGPRVADVAAGEEALEPVVGGARQDHPAQDFQPLGSGQRRDDRRAPHEAVAVVNQGAARLLQSGCRGDTRCRLAETGRHRLRRRQTLQLVPDLAAQCLEGRLVARLFPPAARSYAAIAGSSAKG